jgi:hypothetical protein
MKRRYVCELVLVAAAAGCSSEGMVADTDPSSSNARSNQPSPANSSAGCPSYPDSSDPTTSAGGACLLSYNTALVDGDPCCYRQGGKNQCDIGVTCNDRSGAGCCLIYGSEATEYGQRCCLYQDRGKVDGAAECSQLLAAGS